MNEDEEQINKFEVKTKMKSRRRQKYEVDKVLLHEADEVL